MYEPSDQWGAGCGKAARPVLRGAWESNLPGLLTPVTVFAGNPARKIKDNVFFTDYSVHNYTKKQSKKSMQLSEAVFVYARDDKTLDFGSLDDELTNASDAKQRLEIVRNNIVPCHAHNRFSLDDDRKECRKGFRLFRG